MGDTLLPSKKMLRFVLTALLAISSARGGSLDNVTVTLDRADAGLIDITFDDAGLVPLDNLTPKDAPLAVADRSTSGCGCGYSVSNPNPAAGRIVEGQEVNPQHRRPYQAFVQICFSQGCFQCGGTLLNKRYVLTAMHCVENNGQISSDVRVVLGDHNIRANIEAHRSQSIRVERVITRPDYDSQRTNNDIAILKLATDATLATNVVPACLPTNVNLNYANVDAVVSGWGTTSEGGSTSGVLKETTVKITAQSDATCRVYGSLPNTQMCAYKQNTDSCQGDSGGPLVVNEDGRFTVVGVVSYGAGCARPGYAGVYARVTTYLDWINQNIADGWCSDTPATTSAPTAAPTGSTAAPTNAPTNAPTTPSNAGPGCDFTCTNVGTLTAESVTLNGIPGACYAGICYGANGFDYCDYFGYPCGGQPTNGPTSPPTSAPTTAPTAAPTAGPTTAAPTGLTCRKQCNLRRALGKLRRKYRKGKLPRFVDVMVNGIPALCDLKSGRCCATDIPDSNLCKRLREQ